MQENEDAFTPEVMYCFMEQLLFNAEIKKWGKPAKIAGKAEAAQLHWQDTFRPKKLSDLTEKQRSSLLPSHIFLQKKRSGNVKGRLVAGGNVQRTLCLKRIQAHRQPPPNQCY